MPANRFEPLASLLTAGPEGEPAAVVARAARALLDLPPVSPVPPSWLAPHQGPAAVRLTALLEKHRGAVLADAAGLGKSYVALAVALMRGGPFSLVVPAVLVPQWRTLCRRFGVEPEMVTHERLSRAEPRVRSRPPDNGSLLIVDEAHHFRNPVTRRYRALARMAIGNSVLLVTATPIHNRIGDVIHLLRLFLRDDALAGLGVPSLKRAASGESASEIPAALARLVVARSRKRAPALALPRRARGAVIRAGAVPATRMEPLVRGIEALAAGPAGALLKVLLLSRLASSLPAFRESLSRQQAFVDFAEEARGSGRRLSRRDFQRLFPRGEGPDLQLALLPLLLPEGGGAEVRAAGELRHLAELATAESDPKAECLDHLLRDRPAKTIVFTTSRATARHLLRVLSSRHRVAAVMGARGLLPTRAAGVAEVLRAFAPKATGATPPPEALAIDVLVATDLASEGLNLQDARRVLNYDMPWTPARLAQRIGRIDRVGSAHRSIETVSILPPTALDRALRLELRLIEKASVGRRASVFDWCDRLQGLGAASGPGEACAVRGAESSVALVVEIGDAREAWVVTPRGITTDPECLVRTLGRAASARPLTVDRVAVHDAVARVAPALRRRIDLLGAARWRAPDRDQLSRRLIPMVVMDARRAARLGHGARVARLDAVIERLGRGMTAGEELALDDLVASPSPLTCDRLLEWSERLPAFGSRSDVPALRLVAAVVVRPGEPD